MPVRLHCSIYSSTTLGISLGEKACKSMESSMGRTTGPPKGESSLGLEGNFSDGSFLSGSIRDFYQYK